MDNPLMCFSELRDPRIERNREHLVEGILLIAIAAVLSGAESLNDLADYGKPKQERLKTFLTLPSGIPSHDTFNRVIAALDPEEMEKGFVDWVLDVGFGEDLDRKRAGHAAQNFSLLNRIALNLLKQETTFKRGIKGKRLKAALDHPTCSNYWEFDMRRP